METIWPNGKATKDQLVLRIDRAEKILQRHAETARTLRYRCANHVADALGCIARCLVVEADRALEAAEREKRIGLGLTWLRASDVHAVRPAAHHCRATRLFAAGPGHPKDGWPA